jgi:hypothetical protein
LGRAQPVTQSRCSAHPPHCPRIAKVDEDTEEAFGARRQLVKLLMHSITVGKRHEEDGGIEERITYRFGPPSPLPPNPAGS